MKKTIFLLIFTFCIISAYPQLRSFRVEIPYPPPIAISDSIQSLTLLNRSVTHEFENYDERELQIEFYKKNFSDDMILLDSVAADSTIKSLGIFLFESERFDIVIPTYNSVFRTETYTSTPEPFDWAFVNEMCSTYQTDALAVLENIAIRTVTNYNTAIDSYSFMIPQEYHYASMDFYSRSHWRIYYPETETIIVDIQMNHDTIYWDYFDYSLSDLFKGLPSVKSATIETSVKTAYDFSQKITPQWKSENRYYYVIRNKNIDKSVEMAATGNWQEALDNWLQYAESGNRFRRSKTQLNIALAYEMVGDLNSAIQWAQKSSETYYRSISNHYLKELLKRHAAIH